MFRSKHVWLALPGFVLLSMFSVTQAFAEKEETGFDNVPVKKSAEPPRGIATHIKSKNSSGNSATHIEGGQAKPHAHPNNPTPGRDQINGITASLYHAEHGNDSSHTGRRR